MPTDLGLVEVPPNHLSMVMTWGWFMVLGESHIRVIPKDPCMKYLPTLGLF